MFSHHNNHQRYQKYHANRHQSHRRNQWNFGLVLLAILSNFLLVQDNIHRQLCRFLPQIELLVQLPQRPGSLHRLHLDHRVHDSHHRTHIRPRRGHMHISRPPPKRRTHRCYDIQLHRILRPGPHIFDKIAPLVNPPQERYHKHPAADKNQ